MNMILPRGIYLAPMVSASELAFRMLVRKCGHASLCYSPMFRANDVISVANNSKKYMNIDFKVQIDKAGRTNSVEETAYLLLQDCHPEDTKSLVVQLCGSCPDLLFTATTSIMDLYSQQHNSQQPFGIDLNLGCPQKCAEKEGFGAFLVERSPDLVVSCISSMRRAIDTYASKTNNVKRPLLSAKIRLLESVDDTIEFIRRLKAAGLDYLAIHCRNRAAKHDGLADHEAGSRIVDAFDDFPIILNGGISDSSISERVIQQTNCHAVMVATGYLKDHSLSNNSHNVANLALEYLDYAEKYPPPSYLYIQKHLRWIFRETLQPKGIDTNDYADYRVKLWTFLVRPYLRTIDQFRLFVSLYVRLSGDDVPNSISHMVNDVTFKTVKKAGNMR